MTLRKPGIDQNRCQERSEDDVARTDVNEFTIAEQSVPLTIEGPQSHHYR